MSAVLVSRVIAIRRQWSSTGGSTVLILPPLWQRLRATLSCDRAQGPTDGDNSQYPPLHTHTRVALPMALYLSLVPIRPMSTAWPPVMVCARSTTREWLPCSWHGWYGRPEQGYTPPLQKPSTSQEIEHQRISSGCILPYAGEPTFLTLARDSDSNNERQCGIAL